jgi:hypothetical protein
VQSTLDYLIERGEVTKAPGSATYSVQASLKQRIEVRIESAKNLESSVKTNWLQQCKEKFTTVDGDLAWTCLQHYLSKLFRRHGLQTVLLLDATADGTDEHAILLRSSLDDALTAASCGGEQRPVVENSIHLFLETVGTDADRTKFIVQLADGAFSYYSLSAPPEVAQRLQDKLKELTLFLDTNFLFGLLGLHVNPLDAVSEELISVIRKNRLNHERKYPNVLVFTNSDRNCGFADLVSTLTGNFYAEGGGVDPIYKNVSEGRIRKEKLTIDLYVWFDEGHPEKHWKFFVESSPHYAALSTLLGSNPANHRHV